MSLHIALRERVTSLDLLPYLQSRLLWAAIVAVMISTRYIYSNADMLLSGAGGADDITRLLQVRELVGNWNWFDRTLGQIGAPTALQSHWSRLIDLPLAILIGIFGFVYSVDTAEMIVRVIWPTALLSIMLFVVLREAEREAGLIAVIAVFVLVVYGAKATFQFNPGRVDHHNIQILCAVGGVLLLQRSFSDARMGWWAGGLLGLGMAVGLEALLLVGALVGMAALFSVFCYEMRDGLLRALIACSGVAWLGFVVTTVPAQWLQPVCDELSINLVLMLTVGAGAYAILQRKFEYATALVWLGGLLAGGVIAVGVYLAVEPVCAGGPLAAVDPAVTPIWLDKVVEVQSLMAFAEVSPSGAISFLVFVVLGCVALGRAWHQRRDGLTLFSFVVLVVAAVCSCFYVKLIPYAMWLTIPAVAVAIARLPGIGEISARTVQIGAMIVASQGTILVMVGAVVGLFSAVESTAKSELTASTVQCQDRIHLRALGKLPPGLIANELDLGSFIALNSKHRVVSAPYHRIDKSIVATFDIIKGSLAKAEKVLRGLGADYVVVCKRDAKVLAKISKDMLMYDLQTGREITFLERIKVGSEDTPLMVWRVLR